MKIVLIKLIGIYPNRSTVIRVSNLFLEFLKDLQELYHGESFYKVQGIGLYDMERCAQLIL